MSPEPPTRQPGHVVVHLALHPANVLVSAEGLVLIDWSIARTGPTALDTAMTAMTLAAAVVAGIPSDAGDVARLEIGGSFVTAVLDSYLAALSEPRPLRWTGPRPSSTSSVRSRRRSCVPLSGWTATRWRGPASERRQPSREDACRTPSAT